MSVCGQGKPRCTHSANAAISASGSFPMAFACTDQTEAGTGAGGAVELRQVVAEATGGMVLMGNDASCTITIRNSVLRDPGCDSTPSKAVSASGPTTISGSELVDCGCGFEGEGVKISASLIDQSAGSCTYGAAKIVGCWDKEFEPIVYPPPAP